MTLIDLSLPVLALLLLGIVLYNVRIEKRRSRRADHTVREVSLRDVTLNSARDIIDVEREDDDDRLRQEPRPFQGLSRH